MEALVQQTGHAAGGEGSRAAHALCDAVLRLRRTSALHGASAVGVLLPRARASSFAVREGGGELPPTEGGVFNPHSALTRNRNLRQNNVTFDCPQISFVSSFIEKAGDASRTIVGYGLNDCTGRLVEVRKSEIARLLYPDPMDMLFEDNGQSGMPTEMTGNTLT